MKSCKFLPYGLPLYIVALIVPWIFLYFWVHPTAEQWEQLNHFVLVEVSKNLYLVFLPTVPLFFYLQSFRIFFWYGLSLLGLVNLFRFLCHYYFPLAVFRTIPAVIVEHLALTNCATDGHCSILSDLWAIHADPEKGAQIWVDDAVWVYIVAIPFILLESWRYHKEISGGLFVLFSLVLGFDTALPLFFIWLQHFEKSNYSKVPRHSSSYAGLFLLLGVGAVSSWMPNLYGWVMLRGTVAGQLEAGCKLAVGARATWAIMGLSFSTGLLTIPQCNVSAGNAVINFVLSWVIRIVMVVLICSNVAGALASYLFFRELVPGHSFLRDTQQNRRAKRD